MAVAVVSVGLLVAVEELVGVGELVGVEELVGVGELVGAGELVAVGESETVGELLDVGEGAGPSASEEPAVGTTKLFWSPTSYHRPFTFTHAR
jgi:hypothetical protein